MIRQPLSARSGDVLLDGEVFLPDEGNPRVVVLCHGLPRAAQPSAEDQTPDRGYAALAETFVQNGYAAALFNFRGTGNSQGHLEIQLWPQDLRAVLDALQADPKTRRICYPVIGFSTGGSAAIVASAIDARIDPLIACAAPAEFSFLSFKQNAQAWFDLYKMLGMIRDGYEETAETWAANSLSLRPVDSICASRAKTIILLHGQKDDTVPVEHAVALADNCQGRVKRVMLPESGHQLRKEPETVSEIIALLGKALGE